MDYHTSPATTTAATPGQQQDFGGKLRHSKALFPALGIMAVAVAVLAGTLVMTRGGDTPPASASLEQPGTTAPAATQAMPATPAAPVMATTPPKAQPKPVPVQQAQGKATQAPPRTMASTGSANDMPRPDTRVSGAAPATAQAQVCATCGVIESVTPVQRQGQPQGIAGTPITAGAVAGGVIGGLLGNQVGGGSGKTAATVLGAAGGAYAGNEVQKNMSKVTVYQVRVRMDDGSVRTVEQRTAPNAGSRVVLDQNGMRPA